MRGVPQGEETVTLPLHFPEPPSHFQTILASSPLSTVMLKDREVKFDPNVNCPTTLSDIEPVTWIGQSLTDLSTDTVNR